jgi:hypothetical protein
MSSSAFIPPKLMDRFFISKNAMKYVSYAKIS